MAGSVSDVVAAADETSEAAVLRKVTLRLIPFLFLLYVVNILDRVNISFAKLQMLDDLHMDNEAYGFGFGVFYVGYLLFEVPSNLILQRVGARSWIARILVSWGLISSCMMFVTGPVSLCLLRVLLGFAEAGFFPGIILYLSHWIPARARGRAVAMFMTGGLIASIIGNPIAGAILDNMNETAGLAGWQWLFLLEGIPSVVLGFVTFFYLTDRPEQAQWLTPAERAWLLGRLELEKRPPDDRHSHTLQAALTNPRVWLLIAVYFTVALGDNSFGSFLPTFLEGRFPTCNKLEIGWLADIPSAIAILGMVVVGLHSDHTGERRWHVAGPAFVAAAGWVLVAFAPSPWLFVLALAVTLTGMKSMLGTFWTLPASFLSGTAAAGGIALINSVANLGGLLGPTIIGKVEKATGSFTNGLLVMAVALAAGGILVLCVRHTPERATKSPPAVP